jgi:hypothetical protein
MDMAEKVDEDDIVNPKSTSTHPPFVAGDHVVLPCNAAGLFPYEHHAIVISVGMEIDGVWTMCVSDFTIDASRGDDDDGEGGVGGNGGMGSNITGSSSGSGSGSARGMITSALSNVVRGGDVGVGGGGGGLRLLCVDAAEWRRVDYDSHRVDHPELVRRRVSFLLANPHIVPPYSIVDSNCECVAVWCKTGRWSTLQFSRWAGSANMASRAVVAGGVSAAYCSIIVPGGAFLLAAGMIAEVVTGVWGDRARRGWEDRTTFLNDEFDRSTRTKVGAVVSVSTSDVRTECE